MIRSRRTGALLAAALLLPALRAEPAPAGRVLAVMERVADWQMAHPDKSSPTGWVNAAYYAGAMALAGISPSPRFVAAMRRMGEANAWKLGPRRYDADDHCVGQTYAEIYLRDRDPRMIAPMQAEFDAILAHPKDDNLSFDSKKNPDRRDRWSWCDSLFMGPPTWIRLWAATGNRAYLDFMVEKWWVTSDYLYDRDEHLYFRDSTMFSQREKNGRKIFWSRGNGWVMAGLARVLDYLPADHPARPRFEQQFREMASAVIAQQQADGLWRASLLDPAHYPMKETSGSGFFCYALAWGVNHGLLDRATFAPAAFKAWHALVACVADDGRLTHVQPVGFTPVTFDANATAPYGVGAFLLAGSEIHRLAAPGAPVPPE
jgi:rhamnogalacturonyl hydrolase YesR